MAITTGAAILGGALLGGGVSLYGARKASKASKQAAATSAQAQISGAEVQAQSQREALEYLKQREAMPQQFREAGLQRLGGLYGLEGGVGAPQPEIGGIGSQQQLIDQARQSPLYGALMGGREAGEEAIMRGASATGGLRSGNVQSAMYDYNTQLQNQALLQSYNQQMENQIRMQQQQEQGLRGLAGLPSYAPQIASGMAGVGATLGQGVSGAGQTLAQGQVASGQAWQQGLQGISDIAGKAAGQWVDYKTPRI
jgi:hypothetical protein